VCTAYRSWWISEARLEYSIEMTSIRQTNADSHFLYCQESRVQYPLGLFARRGIVLD